MYFESWSYETYETYFAHETPLNNLMQGITPK